MRRCWLSLCIVWPSHSQWPNEQINFITMRLPILQLSCRHFWQKLRITQVCQHPYNPDLAPCGFWVLPNLKSPLKGRRFVNATVTQYTSAANGVSLPTYQPHGRLTVNWCTVRSTLTGCQVTSRSGDQFSRYPKWLGSFRTALACWLSGLPH